MTSRILPKGSKANICIPITGQTFAEIQEQLTIIKQQEPDVIEWRGDFFKDLADEHAVFQVIATIKAETDIPLLFTIRSVHEGGESISLSEAEKVQLLEHICAQTAVDLVDYETRNEEIYVRRVVAAAKASNKEVILSYHNFQETPDNAFLLDVAHQATAYGADVAKFAVMPRDKEDVFRLLAVTREADKQLAIPVISMSMGELGALSRVIGWTYGSVLTFAVGVASSAPGQIAMQPLKEAIRQLEELMPNW